LQYYLKVDIRAVLMDVRSIGNRFVLVQVCNGMLKKRAPDIWPWWLGAL